MFLYERWNNTTLAALVLAMLLAMVLPFAAGVDVSEVRLWLALLLAMAGVLLSTPIVIIVGRVIDEVWLTARTQTRIQAWLYARRPARPAAVRTRRDIGLHQVSDRFAGPRRDLARMAELLAQVARKADRTVPAAGRPHPVATLLRACSAHLQAHVTNVRSLTGTAPAAVDVVLHQAAVVLVGPRRVAVYQRLADRVSAFDADGAPATDPPDPDQGPLTGLVRRTADAVETSHRLLVSTIGVLSLLAALYLFFTGRLTGLNLLKLSP
jgi:hypothetical protein